MDMDGECLELEDYLPTTLSIATDRIDKRFGAIVIDEGQDFRELWWVGIEDMLEEDGSLYVFYDDNQAIYTSPQELPINIDLTLPLYTNRRNTRNIHNSFQPYTSSQSICHADPRSQR
jgi:superfamily I DNA/RNA helicase